MKKNLNLIFETNSPRATSGENIEIENIQVVSDEKNKIYLSLTVKNNSDKKLKKPYLKIISGKDTVIHRFKKTLKPKQTGFSDELIEITAIDNMNFETIDLDLTEENPKSVQKDREVKNQNEPQKKKIQKTEKAKSSKGKKSIALLLIILFSCLFAIFLSIFMISQLRIKSEINSFTNSEEEFAHTYIMALKNPKYEDKLDKFFIEYKNARYNMKNLKFKSMVKKSQRFDIEILALFQKVYDFKQLYPSESDNYSNSLEMKKNISDILRALGSLNQVYQKDGRKDIYRDYIHAAILAEQYLLKIDINNFKEDISLVSKSNDNVPVFELFKIYEKIINRSLSYLNKK